VLLARAEPVVARADAAVSGLSRARRGDGAIEGSVRRFITPPVFEGDASRTATARHLSAVILSGAASFLLYGAALPFVAPQLVGRLLSLIPLLAAHAAAFLLMRAGRLVASAVFALASVWLVFAVTGYTNGGVRTAQFFGNLLVIINAANLLGWPGILAFTAATAAEGIAFAALESAGRMPPLVASPWVNVLLMAGILTVGILTQRVAMSSIRDALRRAQREIAERTRTESLLRASEERYRMISEVTSDYSFSSRVDDDGVVHPIWAAGAFGEITGCSFEEYIARGGWLAFLHPDDAAQDARDMAALRANRPVVTEVRTLHRDGSVRWVRVYAHPVWDERRQQLTGIYGAVQDVSARHSLDAERERLIRELELRNAELERFTYTVSHDLKAPLITIQGFLGLLERDLSSGDAGRARTDMTRITSAADRMRRLLSELLDLSRIGRVINPPEDVPFAEVAREAVEAVRGTLDARGVAVRIGDGLPVVRGDRMRLVEAVQNLVDNAAKFTAGRPDARVEIGLRAAKGQAQEFFVRDNGIGIDPAYHERIFGLFDKLDPTSEGTGVGLALVKRIIEIHGGRIRVESEGIGKGATFLFTLPLAAQD
jgi:PAS domain S-box-containing protein